ncbi:MAG TPA: FAD/NAD(P)-binding protein [Anaerohalosphaeraceae bacterium]|nr:FAD/NAD(P)-binding protein [Phycisphaerae bacterium]HOK97075.1 FAD/NAD(P)-binding protein [Anaerohalosphaeraceae bacterium]HPC63342.1 FAD/NAD(P)-binding protein [Anaerohalosphaeraceae bacterium]HPO69079.1 FAD/NAD(P)-binding protein [Anaerohalosphaeraceae bacterium]HRS70244.1 FAD/NAD(P)-binding protein [Anaerohalosphaeraceae bacterium]
MCNCCNGKNDIYRPELWTITKHRMLNGTEMFMHLEQDSGRGFDYMPGQFVEVSLAGIGEAPISISSSPTQKGLELVVRNVGGLTRSIHKLQTGDKLGIRGPYGSTYPVEQTKGKDLVFICGGIGLVPQRSFIRYALDHRQDYRQITVLIGTKCYDMRLFREEIALWQERKDMVVMETVDEAHDCWDGNVGVVTTLIPKIESDLPSSAVLVCGPPIMYKFVLMALAEAEVPEENIYVNLERRMKCGVGKCGHCQINDKYVCQDGPVFRWSDLALVPEAI